MPSPAAVLPDSCVRRRRRRCNQEVDGRMSAVAAIRETQLTRDYNEDHSCQEGPSTPSPAATAHLVDDVDAGIRSSACAVARPTALHVDRASGWQLPLRLQSSPTASRRQPPSHDARDRLWPGGRSNAEAGHATGRENVALEGLVNSASDGRPCPWLAESWSLSDDGLALRVDLRPAATFHDGSPVDAAAVARHSVRSACRRRWARRSTTSRTFARSRDYEVEFRFERPSPFLTRSARRCRSRSRTGAGRHRTVRRRRAEHRRRSSCGRTPTTTSARRRSIASSFKPYGSRSRGVGRPAARPGRHAVRSRASTRSTR